LRTRVEKAIGFEPVLEWKSCFWHPELRLLLVVYVDDFKMSGPAENLSEGWRRITAKIKTEIPSEIGRCLGCDQKLMSSTVPCGFSPRMQWLNKHACAKDPPVVPFNTIAANVTGATPGRVSARFMKYDMRSFLVQCVSRYTELAGGNAPAKISVVETPFLDESRPEFDENDVPADQKGVLGDIAS
jgi:hypothetical protein